MVIEHLIKQRFKKKLKKYQEKIALKGKKNVVLLEVKYLKFRMNIRCSTLPSSLTLKSVSVCFKTGIKQEEH